MKISLVATDSSDDWLQVWQSWLQIELDELYRLHWSVFQNYPSFLLKNAKYDPKYPKTQYLTNRFAKWLAPTLTMMAPDRTRRALPIALVDASKRFFQPSEKCKIRYFLISELHIGVRDVSWKFNRTSSTCKFSCRQELHIKSNDRTQGVDNTRSSYYRHHRNNFHRQHHHEINSVNNVLLSNRSKMSENCWEWLRDLTTSNGKVFATIFNKTSMENKCKL